MVIFLLFSATVKVVNGVQFRIYDFTTELTDFSPILHFYTP